MDNLETPQTYRVKSSPQKFFVALAAVALILLGLGIYFLFPQFLPWQPKGASPSEDLPAKAVTVLAKDFSFTPSTIYVLPNQSVETILVNQGQKLHNFAIEELGIATLSTAKGERSTLRFTAPADASRYPLHVSCQVPGHKEAGMTATIVLEDQ